MISTIETIQKERIKAIEVYLRDLQNRIGQVLEKEEGQAQFQEDSWQHPSGGGGLTRALSGGRYIEKACVNFSHVQGEQLPLAATQKRPLEIAKTPFQALGLSVVIHPLNPYVPTTHANVRFIMVEQENK